MKELDCEVVIAGGGPVGLALASLLGKAGHSVCLVERFAQVYPLPRAIRFDGEVMRIFQDLKISEEIGHEIVAMDGYRWFGADGKEIVYLDDARTHPSGWPYAFSFWQPTIDAALDRRAASFESVEMLRGWAAEDLAVGDREVELTIRRGTEEVPGRWEPTETTRTVRAAYVVGADGANSAVRNLCKIEEIDFGFDERWLVVDVRPDDLTRWPARTSEQHCNPVRPTVQVPNGQRHRRWEFMLLPGESPEDFEDPDRVWELLAPHISRQEGELVRFAAYQFRSKVAKTMNRGRALLAGDAAHVMPPFMGEGMCSGLRDANNLAWRLDLLLRNLGREDLLDAYTRERLPHNEAMIKVSLEMGKVSCTVDPAAAAARDQAFRGGDVPPPPPPPRLLSGTLREDDPVAGRLTPQGVVRSPDGAVGRFDDVFGQGFALVCLDCDPGSLLDTELLEFLDLIGAQLVDLGAGVTDEDGALTSFMRDEEISAFLARPDGYGFGSVAVPEDLPELVAELRDKVVDAGRATVA